MKKLFLRNNQKSELDENLFIYLLALDSLILANNQIKYLQSNIFDSLVNLQVLDLEKYKLMSIDSCLLKISKN